MERYASSSTHGPGSGEQEANPASTFTPWRAGPGPCWISSLATLPPLGQELLMCGVRGLDSQVPSTSTLNNTTHLLNHHTIAGSTEDLLLSGVTRQGARRGGTGNKEP